MSLGLAIGNALAQFGSGFVQTREQLLARKREREREELLDRLRQAQLLGQIASDDDTPVGEGNALRERVLNLIGVPLSPAKLVGGLQKQQAQPLQTPPFMPSGPTGLSKPVGLPPIPLPNPDATGQTRPRTVMPAAVSEQPALPMPNPDPTGETRPRRVMGIPDIPIPQRMLNPHLQKAEEFLGLTGVPAGARTPRQLRQLAEITQRLALEALQFENQQIGQEQNYHRDLSKQELGAWDNIGVRIDPLTKQPAMYQVNKITGEQRAVPLGNTLTERELEAINQDQRLTTRPVRTAGAWVEAEQLDNPTLREGATRKRRADETGLAVKQAQLGNYDSLMQERQNRGSGNQLAEYRKELVAGKKEIDSLISDARKADAAARTAEANGDLDAEVKRQIADEARAAMISAIGSFKQTHGDAVDFRQDGLAGENFPRVIIKTPSIMPLPTRRRGKNYVAPRVSRAELEDLIR